MRSTCWTNESTGSPRFTCVISVVLNATVKVNQAAILLASPGQPRHQPKKRKEKKNQPPHQNVSIPKPNKCWEYL